jgi:DNA modification methylase
MKAYFEENGITIYNADCRDALTLLNPDSYFGWTDPPYNAGKDYGPWNDSLTDEEYLNFVENWLTQFKNLCSENAVFMPKKYFLEYYNLLGPEYKQIVVTWTPEGAIRYGFIDQFSSILTNAKPVKRLKNHWTNVQMQGLGYFFKENNFGHPGYTSLDLTLRVLCGLCGPDRTVIDPFLGTGTTLVAAKKLGLKAIGVEINERYCEIAANRLAQNVFNFDLEKQTA